MSRAQWVCRYIKNVPYLFANPTGQIERQQLLSHTCKPTKTGNSVYCLFSHKNKVLLEASGYTLPDFFEGYDWPGRFNPWPHQKQTTRFMIDNPRGWVLNEPRTGKTSSAGWAIERLFRTGDIERVLILAPKTILVTSWERELRWIMPNREIYVANGSVAEMDKVLTRADGGPSIIVANHDKVRYGQELVNPRRPFCVVIPDEASKFKHRDSQRSRALRDLVKKPSTWFWPLTGTPCSTAPTDVWHVGKLVNPAIFPKFFGRFRDKVMFEIPNYGWRPRPGWEDTVAAHLEPSFRVRRKDCFEIPSLVYNYARVDLVPEQKQAVRQLMKAGRAQLREGGRVVAVTAAHEIQKIMQVAAGVVYDDQGKARVVEKAINLRAKHIVSIGDESPKKVIVVCAYTSMLDTYVDLIAKASGTEVVKLDGRTSAGGRTLAQEKFRDDPSVKYIVANPEAVQFGVNLSQADTTIWVTPTASPEAWVQTNDRMFAPALKEGEKLDVIMLCGCRAELRAYKRFRMKETGQIKTLDQTNLYEDIFNDPDFD